MHQQGDKLPVSAFDAAAGSVGRPLRETRYRRDRTQMGQRNCIQCNQCSLVCPHAVIRPRRQRRREGRRARRLRDDTGRRKGICRQGFRIQISPLDCTGCANCVDVCRAARSKALVMEPLDSQTHERPLFDYALSLPPVPVDLSKPTVKSSQFSQPLFGLGACAGCGETPYMKLVTQLFGDRMIIATPPGAPRSGRQCAYRALHCQ